MQSNTKHDTDNMSPSIAADSLRNIINRDIKSAYLALEGLDKVEEELRLAFTNPSYESYTSKMIQTVKFFQMLNYLARKDILLHTIFLLERDKALSEILEKIESEEKYEAEQQKLNREQNTNLIKIVLNEVNLESKQLLDAIDKKIHDVENMIQKLKNDLEYLYKLKTIIEDRIKEKGQQLSLLIAEEVNNFKSDKVFVLPSSDFEGANKYFGENEKPLIIDNKEVKEEYIRQQEEKISNHETDFSINAASFADIFTRKKLYEYFLRNKIPNKETDKAIDHEMGRTEIKNLVSDIAEFANELSSTVIEKSKTVSPGLASYVQEIHNKVELDNVIVQFEENLKKVENFNEALHDMRSALGNGKEQSLKEIYLKADELKALSSNIENLKPKIEADLKNTEAKINSNSDSLDQQTPELSSNIDLAAMMQSFELSDSEFSELQGSDATTVKEQTPDQSDTTKMLLQKMQSPLNGNDRKPNGESNQANIQASTVNDEKYGDKSEKSKYKNDKEIDQRNEEQQDKIDNDQNSRFKP